MSGVDLRLEGAGLARGRGARRRWLVRGVDLTPRRGELLALVGPNGAGKSTLLRLLAGLWTPTEGRVTLDGIDLRRVPRRAAARRVTYVPQHSVPLFEFTVRELVAMGSFPTAPRFALGGSLREARWTERCLERADVAHLAARPATRLSGGELQRVLIARGLATRAEVLLLDEPTASLDLVHQFEVLELARELAAEGRAVAIAIHDLNAALRWADRVAVVERGAKVAAGPPAAVLTPELLARVFGVEARALAGARGELQYRFERARRGGAPPPGGSLEGARDAIE
ncbi:MAG TPA: ABC transporter ATP-binding protein [Thermoanaerobaculia bacterium]|nr:ABC transporter ATP-binding protein [Thermoanaerobaculia bacterium]